MIVFWHRRDPRTRDNAGLAAAAREDGPVVPAFVVDKYRYELSWGEQMYHLLYYNPDLTVANYRSFPNEIAWRDDDAGFEAWTRGETGYPLVDAGMRQLNWRDTSTTGRDRWSRAS